MAVARRGDSGALVRRMTRQLVRVGLLTEERDYFGENEYLALRAWQHHGIAPDGRKLKVDGIYGPNTAHSLHAGIPDSYGPLPESLEDIPEGGACVSRLALELMIAEMRAGAVEVGHNNAGPWVSKYHGKPGATGAWCAASVSWCFKQASAELEVPMPFKYTGGAQDMLRQFRGKGWQVTCDEDNPPQPGDVIVWWRGQTRTWKGHVGFVWGCQDGIVYTVEGNVGSFPARIQVFTYELGNINKLIGFGRVPDDYGT